MREPLPFTTLLLNAFLYVLAAALLTGCTEVAIAVPSETAAEHVVPSYDRDEFGSGWADRDGDGCDSRQETLARDMTAVQLDRDGCTVLYGTLRDPYLGIVETYSKDACDLGSPRCISKAHVDHVVSLETAWYAGAHRWSDDRREAFANDSTNLLIAAGGVNMSKGSKPVSEWLPPNPAGHCGYAERWTDVLRTYELTPAPADAAALAEITEECK
jgi:hypothetical protein